MLPIMKVVEINFCRPCGILRIWPGHSVFPVEYSLTDYGRSLLPLVEAIRLWGRAHTERLAYRPDE